MGSREEREAGEGGKLKGTGCWLKITRWIKIRV